jgi:hypothetical protein
MMAAGVARPKAHGHAMTKTATAWIKAVSKEWPNDNHTNKVTMATPMTTGTKTAETWSTKR